MIKNIKVEDLTPQVKDASLAKLIPTTLVSYKASFEITGGNASLANTLRRAIMSEYETKTLYYLYRDFETTDVFLLKDFLLDRIRMVPILQSVPPTAKFKIEMRNDGAEPIPITMGALVNTDGSVKKPICNSQIILAELAPGRTISISNIHIRTSRGYEHASFGVACNVASVALDVEPPNVYEGIEGVPSSVAAPKHHRITFICNGGVQFKVLMSTVCSDLIARFKHVRTLVPNIQKAGDINALAIRGENDTIAALLCRTIYLQNPNVAMATYFNDNVVRMVTIRIIDDAADTLIEKAIDEIVKQLTAISKYFI